MNASLARSYAHCEHLTRRSASNFFHAFRVLPNGQRRAMCALYAFLRISDDLADGPGTSPEKHALLTDWRRRLDDALHGNFSHPLHEALQHSVAVYHIPRQYLDDVLDGVVMDLDIVRYDTFDDLYHYCYRVASAVGLACIHIWGFQGEKAKAYAESAGIAFQLTNILRDLREDAERGRVYLPREDLERFGYGEDQLRRGERNENFRALMRFETERARFHYNAACPLSKCLSPVGRSVFLVMTNTYRSLLDLIEERDFDVFSSRPRLSSWRKLAFLLRALPVRWGLASYEL